MRRNSTLSRVQRDRDKQARYVLKGQHRLEDEITFLKLSY